MERARTTSVTLGDHYVKFLEDVVATGRYGSVSEIMREALRLFERRVEFDRFLANLPPDDEELIDPEGFESEMKRRESEPLIPHEEVMRDVWGDD